MEHHSLSPTTGPTTNGWSAGLEILAAGCSHFSWTSKMHLDITDHLRNGYGPRAPCTPYCAPIPKMIWIAKLVLVQMLTYALFGWLVVTPHISWCWSVGGGFHHRCPSNRHTFRSGRGESRKHCPTPKNASSTSLTLNNIFGWWFYKIKQLRMSNLFTNLS